jgi:hypothetical protein
MAAWLATFPSSPGHHLVAVTVGVLRMNESDTLSYVAVVSMPYYIKFIILNIAYRDIRSMTQLGLGVTPRDPEVIN